MPSVMLRVDPANSSSWQIYIREGFREIGICPDTEQQILEKFFRPLARFDTGIYPQALACT
ncbi:MAG: hypothetical protein JWL59_5186 [Chthoniobacteraceae bacterium]|nr:hypothetical protein [Chthoniobacteraceae bacterium]